MYIYILYSDELNMIDTSISEKSRNLCQKSASDGYQSVTHVLSSSPAVVATGFGVPGATGHDSELVGSLAGEPIGESSAGEEG